MPHTRGSRRALFPACGDAVRDAVARGGDRFSSYSKKGDQTRNLASSVARYFRLDSKSGVTAIEYGLIAGAIAVAIIATVIALGGDIKNLFDTTGSALNSTTSSSL